MKILFVHECLGAMGGAEANILASARGLHKKGHTPVLLHGPGTGKQEDRWTRSFSECFPIPSGTSSILEEIFSNSEKPDVIYLHKSKDLFLLKQLLDSGLPMSRMVHDHDIYCMRRYKYSPFTRKICRRPTGLACLFPCLAFAERQRGRNFPVGFVSYSAKLRELKLNRCIPRMIVASDYMKNEQDLKALLKGNQHHNGVTFKMKKDPRITPLGRIMRRCSIDELPQLFNVLKGDMSLVGPRPPVPREVALYTPEDRKQLSVIPGITCIWQVSGRSEIDFPDQVILDIRYIQNQGLLEDLKILFLTIPAVISGKGAY